MSDENINVLLKLFDTLKESSDRNEDATKQLIIQQLELVNRIKTLPIDDLRIALKEHAKQSIDDIDNCTGKVSETKTSLMDELRTINNKITKMIYVVVIAFSLTMGLYVFVRSTTDNDAKLLKWQQQIETRQNIEHEKIIKKVIEEIRSEFKKTENRSNGQ